MASRARTTPCAARTFTALLGVLSVLAVDGRARAGRSHEEALAVLENQVAPVGAVGAVFRAVALDGDFHARLHRVAREAAAEERVRRAAFDHPFGHGAIGIFHVD